MSPSGRPIYRSYLLRIWQEAEVSQWRGSLRSVQDDRTLYFASLETLAIFLLRGAEPMSGQEIDDTQARPPL